MDTTKTYIKMCEKATEIQAEHIRKRGDYEYLSALGKTGGTGIHGIDDYYESDGRSTGGYLASRIIIWLPRQDQLQEMIIHLWGHVQVQRKGESPKPYIVPPRALLDYFYTVTCPQITVGTSQVMNNKDLVPQYEKEKAEHQYWSQFTSMEQLWLAFTMKVMYGKIWNGEDWVK